MGYDSQSGTGSDGEMPASYLIAANCFTPFLTVELLWNSFKLTPSNPLTSSTYFRWCVRSPILVLRSIKVGSGMKDGWFIFIRRPTPSHEQFVYILTYHLPYHNQHYTIIIVLPKFACKLFLKFITPRWVVSTHLAGNVTANLPRNHVLGSCLRRHPWLQPQSFLRILWNLFTNWNDLIEK